MIEFKETEESIILSLSDGIVVGLCPSSSWKRAVIRAAASDPLISEAQTAEVLRWVVNMDEGELTFRERLYAEKKHDMLYAAFLNGLKPNDIPYIQWHGLAISLHRLYGFKAVQEDGYDLYSSSIKYEKGKTYSKKWEDVDRSRADCGPGFHFGSYNYALNFRRDPSDRIIVASARFVDIANLGGGKVRARSIRIHGKAVGPFTTAHWKGQKNA